MRKAIPGLLILLAIAGCSNTARYKAAVKSWNGQPASELIQAWGRPEAYRPAQGGGTILLHKWHRAGYGEHYRHCDTSFAVRRGIIFS